MSDFVARGLRGCASPGLAWLLFIGRLRGSSSCLAPRFAPRGPLPSSWAASARPCMPPRRRIARRVSRWVVRHGPRRPRGGCRVPLVRGSLTRGRRAALGRGASTRSAGACLGSLESLNRAARAFDLDRALALKASRDERAVDSHRRRGPSSADRGVGRARRRADLLFHLDRAARPSSTACAGHLAALERTQLDSRRCRRCSRPRTGS